MASKSSHMEYGVLHVAVGIDLFAESLTTPYGTKNQPCGVLHMS